MSQIKLTVHRATREIGGNCIELATARGRILLDVGRPVDAPRSDVRFCRKQRISMADVAEAGLRAALRPIDKRMRSAPLMKG